MKSLLFEGDGHVGIVIQDGRDVIQTIETARKGS